jgi:FecR protein/Anaphase-promoting complex subunit 4 WD40 domain/WD domain, G-beta repeat
MTRTDELSAKLLDGTLTDVEWAELEALLALDPAAEDDHLALLELEGVLRGLRTGFDLAEPTLAKVQDAQAKKTARAVMAEIATHPAPAWSARPEPVPARRSRWRWAFAAAGLAAVAAGLVVGLWLGAGSVTPPRNDDTPPPGAPEYARLTRMLGAVEMLTPAGEVRAVAEGSEVPPGHTLRTVGEDSLARVELPDRTTVDIEPDSIVRFLATGGSDAKARSRLYLAAGQLTAAVPDGVADRQLVVGTGVAEVFARKGTFVVSSAGPDSVRVDLKHGNVEVWRTDAPTRVPLARGGSAVVRAGSEKVFVEPAGRVDRTPARTLAFANPRDAAFSPDGNEIWVASARHFTRWTRDGGTADTVFAARKGGGHGPVAVFTRDRTALVTTALLGKDEKGTRDERVVIRRLPGGEERAEINVKLPDSRLWTAAPAAAWLAVAEPKPNHKHLRVYDGATGGERFAREFDHPVACVAASADGKTLAVGLAEPTRGEHNKAILLDPVTGERLAALPTQRKGLAALTFSADGRYLAAGFNGLVQVWDVRSRELVKLIAGFERVVTCLAFTPDGKALAAGTQDGQVWVWSAATGRTVQLIEIGSRGLRSVAFSPDGKRLVTVANNAPVALWDVADAPVGPYGDTD